ncbi:TPA: hypothetical protein TVL43_001083 [Streptococcus equi subsp. zooepidemicus]|nr:hypothetical protein [Streptococcus equi subsp. zooepidemicus]HEL1199625.1 hypothetical protein [Streptococcus equi subsp. zooepidemicus]HEL1213114.1 hypothetical protein [Streptococcus equi subsp. zooepidemicus]
MSEKSKAVESEAESQNLELHEAKKMTIGEAVRKDSELKAGITEDDSVLDKYIKRHRNEVSSQKFDAKYMELDTASLDNFIKKQREELSKAGLVDVEPVDEASTEEKPAGETSFIEPLAARADTSAAATDSASDFTGQPADDAVSERPAEVESILSDSYASRRSKKKKPLFAILLALLTLAASAFALNYIYQLSKHKPQPKATISKKARSKTSTVNQTSKTRANAKAFEDLYKTFFTDNDKTTLKNSAFDQLPDLEAALKRLEGTAYYDKAKEKVTGLKKQVTAIQAVNGKFTTAAIVNGEKVAAEVKADANFDDLASDTLTTGNAKLDSLLQSSIKAGREQLASRSATQTASTPAASALPASPAAPQVPAVPAPVAPMYGITGYDPSILQRDLSRVPYNQAMIADTGNPAWAFNPGVLERIVATSQARGYISGNDYILEPVNIINGNGYYNMFRPDGTYLFSLNCKTGYFVGNGKGHAEDLDY